MKINEKVGTTENIVLKRINKFQKKIPRPVKRVSMGLTDRRKTAKNLVDSRKNGKILTVSLK